MWEESFFDWEIQILPIKLHVKFHSFSKLFLLEFKDVD